MYQINQVEQSGKRAGCARTAATHDEMTDERTNVPVDPYSSHCRLDPLGNLPTKAMKQLTIRRATEHPSHMTNDQKTKPERVTKKPSREEVKATIKRTTKDMKDVLDRLADK